MCCSQIEDCSKTTDRSPTTNIGIHIHYMTVHFHQQLPTICNTSDWQIIVALTGLITTYVQLRFDEIVKRAFQSTPVGEVDFTYRTSVSPDSSVSRDMVLIKWTPREDFSTSFTPVSVYAIVHLIHVRLQVAFVGVRIPAFGANKSSTLVSGGQLEVQILPTIVSASSLTSATATIGAHLPKTQTLQVRWFKSAP